MASCDITSVSVSVVCEHSLPLVVGEGDPLCRHFKVDDGGRRRGVHGERQGGRLLNRLISRQRLQRHRAQVPHVTRCSVAQAHAKFSNSAQNGNDFID